jgi:hypothetical protein
MLMLKTPYGTLRLLNSRPDGVSKSTEDLEVEMALWVTGYDDEHDRIVKACRAVAAVHYGWKQPKDPKSPTTRLRRFLTQAMDITPDVANDYLKHVQSA